jgi:hypothetical protein
MGVFATRSITRRRRAAGVALLVGFCLPASLAGAQPYVYPQKDQSAEQQQKDEGECHQWAVQQTGVNPAMATTPDRSRDGSLVRGAARGATVGVVAGAIAGDAGKGAAAGAAGGALIGGMRRRDAVREDQAVQSQNQQAYLRAYTACLQGRGYSVN